MSRPHILTEAQLRAAVAVAEAQYEHGRRIRTVAPSTPNPTIGGVS